MRIRKRKVPLPLSLLSPIPLTDPHLFSRSPVTAVQGGRGGGDGGGSSITTTNTIHSQLSDHLTLTSSDGKGYTYTSAPDLDHLIFAANSSYKGVGEGNEVAPRSNDDTSNASLTTATRAGATTAVDDTKNDIECLLSLSNNNAEGWRDGDKAIPLKKRRGSFSNLVEDNSMSATAATTAATTTTTSMIMKIVDVANGINNDEGITANNGNVNEVIVASAKKGNNKRGNTIMEGSRCSRVNGRGWRCCQPTLVGYSLCEHHLGKGRLRSMTNGSTMKARSSGKSKNNNSIISAPLGRDDRKQVVDDDKKLEMKSSFGNTNIRKVVKQKLGVVKARSLSSLLGQTNNRTLSTLADDLATMEHHEKVIDQL